MGNYRHPIGKRKHADVLREINDCRGSLDVLTDELFSMGVEKFKRTIEEAIINPDNTPTTLEEWYAFALIMHQHKDDLVSIVLEQRRVLAEMREKIIEGENLIKNAPDPLEVEPA